MPSVSSLLKSAQATRRRIAEQQDAQVAYDWSLSAKTYDDFVQYQRYLEERRQVYADDASKLLTINKTINAARKAYVSNEIQRQNINIIEGRGDDNTKYSKLVELFYEAVDNQDYDLAQTLNLQLDNLSVKIQQAQIAEQERAARAYSAAAAENKKALSDLRKQLEVGYGDNGFITMPDGTEYRTLASIKRELEQKGQLTMPDGTPDNPLVAAAETAQAMADLVIKEWEAAETVEDQQKLEKDYGPGLADLYTNLKVDFLGEKLSVADLEAAKVNEDMNNPLYSISTARNKTTGQLEYKLVKNKVDDYRYVRDKDGNYVQIATTAKATSPGQSLDAEFTDEGELVNPGDNKIRGGEATADKKQSIRDRLTNLGYTVQSGEGQDGELQLVTPNGETVTATIMPDGSIRYYGQPNETSGGQPGMYEISLFKRNLGTDALPMVVEPGQVRSVAPDEISDFGEASVFGGQISKASEAGRNYLNAYRGNLPTIQPRDLRNPSISLQNNFTGLGAPLTSNLLQNSQFTLRNKQQEEQLQRIRQQEEQRRAANILQQSQIFNLNQTPVRQLASNGVRVNQLRVAPLPSQPRIAPISVAKPTQKITNTNVSATPKKNISVGVSRPRTITLPGLSF